MKKIIPALLASLGIGTAAAASSDIQRIDPKTIRFTMPTVAADELTFVVPTKESFEGAPQFHEDEWCQLEFYPEDRASEIKRLLSDYKAFERKHRTEHGWTEIYARRISRAAVLEDNTAVKRLAELIKAPRLPAPILTTSSSPLGQVKGGFTLALPGSVFLYGTTNEKGVNVLAAMVERGGDDTQLTKAFSILSKSHRLVLVDWRSQLLLLSTSSTGEINVWRP